jgi:A/G-specific adenine glycosylase
MTVAASATVVAGSTVTSVVLMMSRTVVMASTTKGSLAPAHREALLAWFHPRRAAYPWRRPRPDPYEVLVSEIMLQQTQAPRVAAAFGPFLKRFPTIAALAAASRGDVLRAWAGLGYNRRAVWLHDAARVICRDHDGVVPRDVEGLGTLPGVGPYTAAAVASFAYGEPVAAVDANVRRVIARVARGAEAHELQPRAIAGIANGWIDAVSPGVWNAALMDLGRVVCRPRVPRCGECPLWSACAFRATARAVSAPPPRQGPFEGSFRQLRGAIVQALRGRDGSTASELGRITHSDGERTRVAIDALVRDGLLERAGRSRVRLAR